MEFKVKISSDELKAFLTVVSTPDEANQELKPEKLKAALNNAGVNTGINEDILNHIITHKKYNKGYVVAEAVPAETGESAKIKLVIEIEKRPESDKGLGSLEKVDHYGVQKGFITFVKKGGLIAKRIPPTAGKNGLTVTGREIEGVMGKEINLANVQGINTKVHGDNLIAVKDGVLNQDDKKINVDERLVLKGDLNFATGSIILPLDSDIELLVPGDIKSNFKVQCSKITVMGNIEDAQVTAKTLEVKRGIVGKSDLPIIAENISADFIIGSRKIKAKFIEVNKEISGGSKIFTNFLKSKVIQECTVTARYGVWVDYLYGSNDIFTGVDIDENEEYLVWIKQLKGVENAIKEERQKNRALLKKGDALIAMAERMPNNPSIQKELQSLIDLSEKLKKFEKIKKVLEERLKLHYSRMYIEGSPFILVQLGLKKDPKDGEKFQQFNKINIKEYMYDPKKNQIPGLYILKNQEVVVDKNFNINEIKELVKNYRSS